ncbi:MAG: hydrogenase maturation nickel metallochaperone HypA/HybF [Planctomycetota bacterium]|jgi:hydrogenase nickel incorporation protein HypA/HybF
MHELSIAEALVREALHAARTSAPGRRVTEVHVEIGELSGAVPELLTDCYPLAAEGTALAGSVLRVTGIAALLRCSACGEEFGAGSGVGCPKCASAEIEMVRGRELRLTSIEVEDGEGGSAPEGEERT